MSITLLTHRRLRLAGRVAAAALVAAGLTVCASAACAQSYMACTKVEADCEVQAHAMQDLIARSGTSGPYDYVFTVDYCQTALSTALQTSQWPATDNGQPSFPCSP